MTLAPLTELNAVNEILRNMGETPVNSLSGDLPMDASQAQDTLTEVSRAVQTRGWFFNTERVRLTPDGSGHVNLPSNTLRVKTIESDSQYPVTMRGGKLYNLTEFAQGIVWTLATVSVEIVYGLAFTDLPAAARSYITMKAARMYQARELGDQLNLNEDTQDELAAKVELIQEELRLEPYSLLDSLDVYRAVQQNPVEGMIGSYK